MNKQYIPQQKTASSKHKLDALPAIVYFFRVIGMGLGGLAVMVVLNENKAPLSSWIWTVLCCYVWPHAAYFRAKRHPKPFQAEQSNLLVDSFIAGTSISLIQFNLLPSVLFVSIATADKVNSGIPRLWLKGLPLTLAGALICGLFTGFAYQPITSMSVIVASIPVAVLHTLLVSIYSYKLITKLQRQNKKLNILSQQDSLTGFYNRRHWQHLSNQLLTQHENTPLNATLLLIDIDHFKQINDQLGHVLGDDVLFEVAKSIRSLTDDVSILGRLGGDEFAVLVHLPLTEAIDLAERIRTATQSIKLDTRKGIIPTVSIGLADISSAQGNLRNWVDAADRKLYKAKSSGRYCIAH